MRIIKKYRNLILEILDISIVFLSYYIAKIIFQNSLDFSAELNIRIFRTIVFAIVVYSGMRNITKTYKNNTRYENDYIVYVFSCFFSYIVIFIVSNIFPTEFISAKVSGIAALIIVITIIGYRVVLKMLLNTNYKNLKISQETECKVKALPGASNLIENYGNVEIEDLLGRDTIELDNEKIEKLIKNKTVLVTGGGGSIGSELCRQIIRYNPFKLVMVDVYENNLYDIQQELKFNNPEANICAIVASVRDKKRLNEIFKEYQPYLVFHAAAHKHVPLMEESPLEAIKNNVFGTYNVVNCADEYKTKRFILISTDKAVNPTSIMGATKRLCEMIIQAKNKISKTEYAAVRFGNVLGSNGSVIPLFKKQIARGGPVTVTHKEITRFFMTIQEAVSLVLQAMSYAKNGEIFVLDMGKPIKIYDMAEKLIRLSGYEPNVTMKIKIIGLRPGEKLYEEILMNEEGLEATEHNRIHIAKPLNITIEEIEEKLKVLNNLIENVNNEDKQIIKNIMSSIVPTYKIEKDICKEKIEEISLVNENNNISKNVINKGKNIIIIEHKKQATA